MSRIAEQIATLNPGVKVAPGVATVRDYVIRLLAEGRRHTLVEAELVADDERRRAIHEAVSYYAPRTFLRSRLLRRWAEKRVRSIELAPFRPDGINYLVTVFGSARASLRRRVRSGETLLEYAPPRVIPRLVTLQRDSTSYASTSASLGSRTTIGTLATEVIRRIRARADVR